VKILVGVLSVIAGLFVAFAVLGVTYEPNTQIPQGVPGHTVTVQGTPLRVDQRGAGRDVLLIHGSPGSIEDWAPLVDALAPDLRLTAFDRPGHGYSGDTSDYSPGHNADVALALVHQLGLERVIVVGHSYGGATALAMAIRDDPAVSAYVILDSSAYEPGRKPDPALRLIDLPLAGIGFATATSRSLAPSKIRAGLLQQFPVNPPPAGFVDMRALLWSTPKVTHAIAAETLGAGAWLPAQSANYPSIKKPVFIMGQADDERRRKNAERLHGDIPGSSLELLHGTGHYLQIEKTTEVAVTVRRAAALP
jgi:pimeloyl-ACP methyl ester carboxylesterase